MPESKTPAPVTRSPVSSEQDVRSFLETVQAMPPAGHVGGKRGRLIFAMDVGSPGTELEFAL